MSERLKKMFSTKSFRAGGYSAFAGIILVAIAVAIVIMTDSVPSKYTKFDMTKNKLYSLSDESKNSVKSLENDVNIYIIAQNGSEDTMLKNTLEKYSGESDKIKISTKDPVLYPNFASDYTSEKVSANSIIVVCGDKSRYVANSDLYNQQYGQDGSQSVEFNGESKITNAIRAVSETETTKMYISNGHGETQLDSNMADAVKQNNIETEDITLISAENIPEDATCVLMYQPQSDISEDEKTMLDTYITGGGNLLVYTGYTGKSLNNLNTLMQSYGAEMEQGLVVEGESGKYVRGNNHYILPNYGNGDITKPLSDGGYYVLAPIAHAIKTDNSKGTDVEEILTTSSKAYLKKNISDGSTLEKEQGDETGTYTLGVAITKTTDSKSGHIVWYSAQQMLSSQVNQMVSGGNQDLFLNSVNWMCERNDNVTIHAKSLDSDNLTVNAKAGRIWSFVLILVVPALLIALGVYIWMKRRRR